MQSDGIEYVLVLLVDFSDQPGRRSPAEFNQVIFSQTATDKSMYTYFLENSYGKMKVLPGPLGGVYPPNGWIRMPKEMKYYGKNEGEEKDVNLKEFFFDAIRVADEQIDFAPYDRDNDGKINHLMLIHAGNDEAEILGRPDDIWSCMAGVLFFGREPPKADGKTILAVFCVAESPDGEINLGTYCHEFAHSLGAPDLYNNILEPVGRWCLMAQGAGLSSLPHICGILKTDIDANPFNGIQGWLTPITLPEGTNTYNITALASSSGNRLYRVKIASHSLPVIGTVHEYFYFENRNNPGGTLYDTDFSNPGLIIWHVDGRGSNLMPDPTGDPPTPYFAWVEDPTDPQHTQWAITELKNAAYHASTDPQKNFTAFTAETTPNSHRNDGRPSGVSITNISSAGPTMTFTFEFRNPSVERVVRKRKIGFDSYPNPFNPECYLPVGRMEREGGVKIYNILGELVREIGCSSVQELKERGVYWDGRDNRGLEVPSGMYFYEVDGKKVKRMVVLK
jgi:M6 family metalloprotease-like protein